MTRTSSLLLAATILLGCRASAQCVLNPISTEEIEGYLVFGFQDKYRILDKGEIRILDPKNSSRVLASTVIDKEGHFRIRGIKRGTYVLSARADQFIPASVDVKIAGSKKNEPSEERLIVVVLAADATNECGGASITMQSRRRVDLLLKNAQKPGRAAHP